MKRSQNKGYEDLQVWQKSIELAKHIYVITKSFPREELFGLTSQMRRCAVSIPSNIAEGCARNTYKEFLQFLGIASGSVAELKTQMIIAHQIQLLPQDDFDDLTQLINEIGRMLGGLKAKLKDPSNQQPVTSN